MHLVQLKKPNPFCFEETSAPLRLRFVIAQWIIEQQASQYVL